MDYGEIKVLKKCFLFGYKARQIIFASDLGIFLTALNTVLHHNENKI